MRSGADMTDGHLRYLGRIGEYCLLFEVAVYRMDRNDIQENYFLNSFSLPGHVARSSLQAFFTGGCGHETEF